MYMDVWGRAPTKLQGRWKGPAQVLKATSAWIYEIQNLVTCVVKEVHEGRLKFYADRQLEVTEVLMAHVAHHDQGHVIDQFIKARYNEAKKTHEVEI